MKKNKIAALVELIFLMAVVFGIAWGLGAIADHFTDKTLREHDCFARTYVQGGPNEITSVVESHLVDCPSN